MALTPRQLETIEHLAVSGTKTPEQIIAYCESRLLRPHRRNHLKHPELRVPGRRHSKKYYQEIISHYKD